jgi:tetratricopeptide (TPR) repeat protein
MRGMILPSLAFCAALMAAAPLWADDNPVIMNQRGVELGKQKQFEQAMEEFDRAVDIYNKKSAKVLHNRGWVLELGDKYPEAIQNYEEAARRNPRQIVSHENLGHLYYKTGKFDKAVATGEYVLKVDPNNQNVLKWLPDAYTQNLRNKQQAIAKKEEPAIIQKVEPPVEEKKKKAEEKKEHRVFYASYDGLVRYSYYTKGEKDGFEYTRDPGLGPDFPHQLYLNFSPVPMFEFDVRAGNPYLGALSPNLVDFSETFQMMYHLGPYYLGVGFMMYHYNDEFNYGESTKLYDYKGGLIFGANRDNVTMRFLFYPRELPHDGKQSTGRTMDVDYIGYEFTYSFDKNLSFHLNLSVNDYYFFDHDAGYSNYWGLYKIGMGISLTQYDSASERKLFVITFDFTLNFYLLNLNNPEPYKFFNGQGWMGSDADSWFAGSPFTGFYGTGHVFSLRGEEWLMKNFFLYQKIIFELVDAETDHNDLCFLLGAGISI